MAGVTAAAACGEEFGWRSVFAVPAAEVDGGGELVG